MFYLQLEVMQSGVRKILKLNRKTYIKTIKFSNKKSA